MKGSSEDSEPQILAGIAKDLQRSIQVSPSDLVNHLQENQKVTCRGRVKISETLRKVSENQKRISQLLMEMTHKGKGLESYANKETSGSHGGNRYQQELVLYHHLEGSHCWDIQTLKSQLRSTCSNISLGKSVFLSMFLQYAFVVRKSDDHNMFLTQSDLTVHTLLNLFKQHGGSFADDQL